MLCGGLFCSACYYAQYSALTNKCLDFGGYGVKGIVYVCLCL